METDFGAYLAYWRENPVPVGGTMTVEEFQARREFKKAG